MKLFIAFGVCAGGFSAPAARAPATSSFWIRASVVTDGAAVYEKPDFDSTVQDYVRFQTAVFVSKRPYAGLGGLGLFHKIHYGTKTGYVADTDIKTGKSGDVAASGSTGGDRADKKSGGKKKKSPWNDNDQKDGGGKTPVFLQRYLGAAVAMVNFTELYSSNKLAENMLMYGVRMSGPGALFLPLPLDVNLWFASKPTYLAKFNGGGGGGFLVFGDVMLQLPAVNLDDWMVTYGIGMMFTYTKFTVPLRSKVNPAVIPTFDSQELRLGVDFGLGVATRVAKKFLVRGDIKYYIERTQYPGFVGSAQLEF